ncbi:MAG TPA: phosphatase PAP2 family protein [Terriglobales bacterium]|nr:phosphatase PAP2 family protein [Terriglobales bacterium]
MPDSSRPLDTKTRRVLLRAIPLSLVVAIMALLLFAWMAEEVLEAGTIRFDNSIRAAVHQRASPALTVFMRGITLLGSMEVLLPAVLIVLTFLLVRGKRYEAIVLSVTMAGGVILNMVLKLSFRRVRPDPFFDLATPASYAFPSGHALLALCFYGVMVRILSDSLKSREYRWMVWVGAVLLIGLIGLSRIYLGVHHASDVLAGYAAAIVWISAVTMVVRQRKEV